MSDTIFFPFNNDLVNLAYVVAIEEDDYERDGVHYHSRITLHNGNYYRSKFRPDEVFREIKCNCWRIKGSVDNAR